MAPNLPPAKKRKSRKSIARNFWKKRKGSQTIYMSEEPLPSSSHNNSLSDLNCSIQDLDDNVFDPPEIACTDSVEKNDSKIDISGRRIVDLMHVIRALQDIKHFPSFECLLANIEIVGETQYGLKSTFLYKCNMCNVQGRFSTESEKNVPINKSAVIGTIAIGIGHSQLSEFCAALNIPQMSAKTFSKDEKSAMELIQTEAVEGMLEAGKEEFKLAVEAGEVDNNGTPIISTIADGAWSKRSHGSNYNALSGVGCIIGARTKKVLFMNVRNKYCTVCVRFPGKKHECFKNWTKTSTSMEASIIKEGFDNSLQMHNLIYGKLIADGDSSVYKGIRDSKPYGPNFLVEKIECRNHVLRNYIKKIKELFKRSDGDPNYAIVKNFVLKNILKFRTAIVCAIKYRKAQNAPLADRISNLKSDILNGPKHIFGDHTNCASYFCRKHGQIDVSSYNIRTEVFGGSTYASLLKVLYRVANLSSSLLCDVDTNAAESYNSHVNKHVGGKRINFSLKGGYLTRCYAAAVSFNTKGNFVGQLLARANDGKLGIFTEAYVRKHSASLRQHKRNICKKKTASYHQGPDESYGNVSDQRPDMDDLSYEEEKEKFLSKFNDIDIISIERNTLGQASNPLWFREKSVRLTASNFGKVCKMRGSTDTKNTVKAILYPSIGGNFSLPAAVRYGQENEEKARISFENQADVKVEPCGLFIDSMYKFLAASPDGLVGDHAIIEIKCPFKARDFLIKDAIKEKKIDYLGYKKTGEIELNRKHMYMYQVQGQLHISRRDICYFIVYTGKDLFWEVIKRDDNTWTEDMEYILTNFYIKAMLPELVDPRVKRGQTIRSVLRSSL